MNKDQALSQLFERISAQKQPIYIDYDEAQQWQEGVLDSLLGCHLLVKSTQANSITCEGCEEQCSMPIVFCESGERAFVVCDHTEHQSYMGRINIPLIRLQQWESSAYLVAKVVVTLLALTGKPEFQTQTGGYKLGFIKSNMGRRIAYLQPQPLSLVINQQSTPIDKLVYFNGRVLDVDKDNINALLNSAHTSQGKGYTANTDKQTLRKQKTQAMYADWHDEYLRLSKEHPNKSDAWIANKIAKLSMGRGKSPETIRKNMKK
jgi:hypothetical protein